MGVSILKMKLVMWW